MFFGIVLLLTALPYFFFPVVFAGSPAPNAETVKQTILFLANAHIAVTLFFYWDARFRGIRQENPFRYKYLPITAIIGSGVVYTCIPDSSLWIWWAFNIVWQNWHFGRQSLGMYVLVSADVEPGKRTGQTERIALNCSSIFGAIGVIWFVTDGVDFWHNVSTQLRMFACYGTAAIAFYCLIWGIYRGFGAKRICFLVFTVLFFAPQFLTDNYAIGVLTYGVAHSLQYIFMMSIVAFNVKRAERMDGIDPSLITALIFFAILFFGGSIITIRAEFGDLAQLALGSTLIAKFVTGSMFGLVIAHFIVDAHAWRLRDRPQRDYILETMQFLGKR
ncbi:hypothetical protein N9P87_01150 [bacterium]|nr:hypothetical protein [bacterium]